MIRTTITLSICARDAQDTSYLINGTLLGMLSSASQQTHVQTNNRPLQLAVAIRNDDIGSPSALVKHQQMVSAWKDFQHILARKGSSNLNSLLQQYHMFPELLICIDDQRLQAWLPSAIGFYMLRNGQLNRLLPTAHRDTAPMSEEDQPENRQYYSINVRHKDQYYLLPPTLQNFFNPGEAAEMLHGLRQLPAKVSELFSTAHLRGFTEENSWLGLQISRLEEDQLLDEKHNPALQVRLPLFARLFSNAAKIESDESASESVGLSGAETSAKPKNKIIGNFIQKITASHFLPYYLVGGASLLLVFFAIILFLLIPGAKPADNPTGTSVSETVISTAATTTDAISTEKMPTETTALPDLIVIAVKLNLRAEPSREAALLTSFVKNDKLYKLEEPVEGWTKVSTVDGIIGYVYSIYVSESTVVG